MQTTPSNPETSRRPLRLLVKTLLAACVFAGTIAGTAQPAHAANSIAGCFFMEDGNLSPYPVTVHLIVALPGAPAWSFTGISQRLTNGCVGISMPYQYRSNHYAALYVSDPSFGGILRGSTTYVFPGNYVPNLQFGVLKYVCGTYLAGCGPSPSMRPRP